MGISFLPNDAGSINSQAEHAFWSRRLLQLPYVDAELADYEEYAGAFQFGWESFACYARWSPGLPAFVEVEHELACEWRRAYGSEGLPWQMARFAVRDAWERMAWLTADKLARRGQNE